MIAIMFRWVPKSAFCGLAAVEHAQQLAAQYRLDAVVVQEHDSGRCHTLEPFKVSGRYSYRWRTQ